MPEGIYWKSFTPLQRGSIVSACLTPAAQQLGLARHYLVKSSVCSGAYPVIKKVIAIPGDTVVLTPSTLIVDGLRYAYPTYPSDTSGQPLPAYPRGIYKHTSGYWLIGTHHPRSWDSRYWGPVQSQQIITTLKPLFTW